MFGTPSTSFGGASQSAFGSPLPMGTTQFGATTPATAGKFKLFSLGGGEEPLGLTQG